MNKTYTLLTYTFFYYDESGAERTRTCVGVSKLEAQRSFKKLVNRPFHKMVFVDSEVCHG